MQSLYLAAFVTGLLLGVRVMFFGAERRRPAVAGAMPLRRSEPATIAFLLMFGGVGYLAARGGAMSAPAASTVAVLLGVTWAAIVTRVVIAMARRKPEHDPDDPRYVLQGHLAVVSVAIAPGGAGAITFVDRDAPRTVPARSMNDDDGLPEGEEVCIERLDDGVAVVERWSVVEQRL